MLTSAQPMQAIPTTIDPKDTMATMDSLRRDDLAPLMVLLLVGLPGEPAHGAEERQSDARKEKVVPGSCRVREQCPRHNDGGRRGAGSHHTGRSARDDGRV